MAFIETTRPEHADGAVATMYRRQQSAWGYVPNYAKVFCHRPEVMARCTMYTSTEPCPMCTGATFWGGVRRVVFGCSMERLYALGEKSDIQSVLYLDCRSVFGKGKELTEVIGPLLEEEALKVHEGFWV